jgi:hypothetical protein
MPSNDLVRKAYKAYVAQCVETIRANARYKKREYDVVASWLRKNVSA